MSQSLLLERLRFETDLLARTARENGVGQGAREGVVICKELPAHARQARIVVGSPEGPSS